jgi:mono/diheme cytochrome c family protein
MRNFLWFALGVIATIVALLIAASLYLWRSEGLSTKAKPATIEAWAMQRARRLAIPSGAKNAANPIAESPEVLAEARAHWADHCAICHSNNGSGDAEVGRHMYPPAPDMRASGTQSLTDGELFYIIENGIRLTGMPAWGNGSDHDQTQSWKLVRFIRHLPALTPEEEREMRKLNPKSPHELQEEMEEREFLEGGQPDERKKPAHH